MMKNNIITTAKQIIVYFFVGLFATLVEWGVFFVLDILLDWHYAWAVSLAFVFSTFANWAAGRIFLFKRRAEQSTWQELLYIYSVSCLGLLANIFIMFIAIDLAGCGDFPAKIIATAIVFFGNFFIRKYWIYKI